jgi:hypothetical protein
LPALRQKCLISSTAHRSDGVHVRIVAEVAPAGGARQLEPSLEDAYLAALSRQRSSSAGSANGGTSAAASETTAA